MDNETKPNPYLVLGVDFGASITAANAAFGRATRRLRKQEDAPYSLHDLTAALSRIEEAQRAGDQDGLAESFQVPADPEAYEVKPDEGLLLLPVQTQQRKTAALSRETINGLRHEVIHDALDVLADELDTHPGVYGLGIDLGAPVSLDRSPASMSSAVADMRATAYAQLERDVAGSSDPDQLQEWGDQALGANVTLPESLAIAFLENRHTPAQTSAQIVAQLRTTPTVLSTLSGDPETPPDVLKELSGVDDRDTRIQVAKNPSTPSETRDALAADKDQVVRKAAAKYQRRHDPRRRKLYLIAGIVGIVLLVGIVAAVLLSNPSETPVTSADAGTFGSSEVQEFLNTEYLVEEGIAGWTVACPAGDIPAATGTQFECTFKDEDGDAGTVVGTVSEPEGRDSDQVMIRYTLSDELKEVLAEAYAGT